MNSFNNDQIKEEKRIYRTRFGDAIKLSKNQENLLCSLIDYWYLMWKYKMTDNSAPHSLGVAKEELKRIVCDSLYD